MIIDICFLKWCFKLFISFMNGLNCDNLYTLINELINKPSSATSHATKVDGNIDIFIMKCRINFAV